MNICKYKKYVNKNICNKKLKPKSPPIPSGMYYTARPITSETTVLHSTQISRDYRDILQSTL